MRRVVATFLVISLISLVLPACSLWPWGNKDEAVAEAVPAEPVAAEVEAAPAPAEEKSGWFSWWPWGKSAATEEATVEEPVQTVLQAEGPGAAKIFFLRETTERRMGYPDNKLTVLLNNEPVLELAKGDYAVVNVVPRDYVLTLRNLSEVGPNWKVREMERDFRFEFVAGETYFFRVRAVNGEFRGVHFVAEPIGEFEAGRLAASMRGVGGARIAPRQGS